MSDVVFVLGAGASKQCGAPLMTDFLDVANNLHRTGACGEKRDDFERVFRAIGSLQAVHSKSQLDLTNIESIFTALEIAKILGKLPEHGEDDIEAVIASLKELIVCTLERTITFPTRGSHIGAPAPYDKFAELLTYLREEAFPAQSVSVITFNYDIAADLALHHAGLGPDYGIPPDTRARNPVPLLKLHGSLNWASREDGGTVYPLPLEQYLGVYRANGFGERGTCKVPIGSQLVEYFHRHTDVRVEPEPVIVPPTWNKADHHQSLAQIWSTAARHLGEADSIFILGYSLPDTDAFFRLLYALGTVGAAPLSRIAVYNPDDSGSVKARFRGMLGPAAAARFQYRPLRFEEAVSEIKALFPARQ